MISPVFVAFLSLSSFANVAHASLACPGNNGQTFVDPASQSTYVIECGVDRPGADIQGGPGWTNSLEACIALCSTTPQCVEVVYNAGSPGPCYLKNALNHPTLNGNVMAAHLLSAEGPKCPPTGAANVAGVSFRGDANFAQIDMLAVGDRAVLNQGVLVYDMSNLQAAGFAIRGLLGEDFLSQFNVFIDNAHHVLCLDSAPVMQASVADGN